MHAEQDLAYRQQIGQKNVNALLRALQRGLLGCVVALILIQGGLIAWVSTQCSTIIGLSVDGRIFYADSLTCPYPGVESVFAEDVPTTSGNPANSKSKPVS